MILLRVLFQTVFLALGQIWANKVRAFLTTLGIMIGVAAVVATVAATDGMRTYVLKEFEAFGAKKVYIDGTLPRSQWHTGRWREVQLKEEEVHAIAARCASITRITPHWMGSYTIRAGERELENVRVTGIWPQWHDIEGRSVLLGRQFIPSDEEEHQQVCIINDKAIDELLLDKNPVGQSLLVAGRKFLIVGVVETKELGAMFGGGDTQTEVYIPFSMARNLNPNGWLNYAVAELSSPEQAEDVQAEIRFLLRRMRGLKPEEEDTFEVEVMQQFIDQFKRMAAAITAGAGGIVGISLLVGGIGIMNIMLVSVSERTREIGLRKAVGAPPAVVLLQFLVEAVVLCLVGGAFGLGMGQGLVLAMRNIPGEMMQHAAVPLWAVGLSVGFSAATGILFGMFPAIKAARLDPIVALRHE